jgi:hypothetical protein
MYSHRGSVAMWPALGSLRVWNVTKLSTFTGVSVGTGVRPVTHLSPVKYATSAHCVMSLQ